MLNLNQINMFIPQVYRLRYGLNTSLKLAMFLAQWDYESAGFAKTQENLHYSAERLLQVFPKYFPSIEEANKYANKPERIANHVYANRMGNGDEDSGDGYKYRGRGYCQLTGHDNYKKCGTDLSLDLINSPDLLVHPSYAMLAALWFWKANNINDLCPDIIAVTKRINGGLNGLDQRQILYDKYCGLIK